MQRPNIQGIEYELRLLKTHEVEITDETIQAIEDLCNYVLFLEAQNAPYITKDEEGCEEEHYRPSAERHYHIKEALRMQENRATMFQTQLIEAAVDAQDIEILQKENFKLQGILSVMQEALKTADRFITNGIEVGYISMPEPSTNDPASKTPGIIHNALTLVTSEEMDYQYDRWNRLRPQVQEFANVMEDVLRQNDFKRGWKKLSPRHLLIRLVEEVGEVIKICCKPDRDGWNIDHILNSVIGILMESTFDKAVDRDFYNPEKVIKEAADVANFCMMIADNCKTILDQKAQDDAGCI